MARDEQELIWSACYESSPVICAICVDALSSCRRRANQSGWLIILLIVRIVCSFPLQRQIALLERRVESTVSKMSEHEQRQCSSSAAYDECNESQV